MSEREEGTELQLDFAKLAKAAEACPGILPVVVQNIDTGDVILAAYTNEQALNETIATRLLTLWSTSRNELWVKGASSGHQFEVLEIFVNCEQNSLLYRVRAQKGGICHTSNKAGRPRNCYYRRLDFETGQLENQDP